MSTQDLGQYIEAVRQNGVRLNANEPLVAAGTNTISGATTFGIVTVPTGKTLTVTETAALTRGGVIVASYEYVTSQALAAASFANGSAYPIYTFPNDGTTWKVAFASVRFTTA